jgi:hypothetical protein
VTIAERLEAAVAQTGYAIDVADRPAFEAWVESEDTEVVERGIALIEKNFPRDTMEERMAEGPFLKFLTNSAPDLESDLDAGIMSFYDKAGAFLEAKGNAGDATAPA